MLTNLSPAQAYESSAIAENVSESSPQMEIWQCSDANKWCLLCPTSHPHMTAVQCEVMGGGVCKQREVCKQKHAVCCRSFPTLSVTYTPLGMSNNYHFKAARGRKIRRFAFIYACFEAAANQIRHKHLETSHRLPSRSCQHRAQHHTLLRYTWALRPSAGRHLQAARPEAPRPGGGHAPGPPRGPRPPDRAERAGTDRNGPQRTGPAARDPPARP